VRISATLAAPIAIAAAVISLLAAARAAAQESPGLSGGVYLELLDGQPLALLEEADSAVEARDFARAARGYQALLDMAAGPLRDHVVLLRPAKGDAESLTAPADDRRASLAVQSLSAALRARLAALPEEGLRAYRAEVDARAGARAAAAIERRDPAMLAEVRARWLFSTRGAEAVILAGDLALEAGDLTAAVSSYEAAATTRDAPRSLEARRRSALARLADEDARADRAPPAAGGTTFGPEGGSLTVVFDGQEGGLSAALTCPPINIPGGVAVVAPGRALVVRDLAIGATEGPRTRSLPPGAAPLSSSRPGPFSLGGAAARGLLAAAIEGPRGLIGAGASAAPATSIFDDAYDLFVFDVARGDKLLFTTADATRFDAATAAWLAGVEWTARPILAPGLVFGAAIGSTGEPEVTVAAFETGASPGPRLRWRTFLCARGLRGATDGESDGPPLEPALTRLGGRVLVDTGLGLAACLDAHTGEVLWAVKDALPAVDSPEWRTALRGHDGLEDDLVLRPADPPIVVPPARAPEPRRGGAPGGTRPGDQGLVLLSARAPAPPAVTALDAATGETVYRLASEGWAFPVAAMPGERLAIVESGALAIVDARSGKRLSSPLPLPRDDAGVAARCEAVGRGVVCEGGRLVVPTRDGALVVSVEESARGLILRPERALTTSAGSCSAAGAMPGGVALSDALGLTFVALDRPLGLTGAAAWEDALGVAEAYDGVFPPDILTRLSDPRASPPAAAPEAGADDPEGDPSPPIDVEVVVDEARGLVRARLTTIPASMLSVSLVLERASGRLHVEVVDESPEPGESREPRTPPS